MKSLHLDDDDILVTGGTGLIGSAIGGVPVCHSQVDLTCPGETRTLFRITKPKSVIHCAAKVGGLGGNMAHMVDYYYENIMMNTNVIDNCREHGVKNLVCFMSTCVFPDDISYPLTSDKIHCGQPHYSNYGYAYAKRMVDIQLRTLRDEHNLEYVSLVPSNIYGPDDNFDMVNGHVIPSLIHKCYRAKLDNTALYVWGTGKAHREFIYSKDVAKIAKWALRNYKGADPLIVSPSTSVSIAEVVELICELMEFEGHVAYEADKPEGQPRKPSSNARLVELMPDLEFTPLREGLKETIDQFITNYHWVRK